MKDARLERFADMESASRRAASLTAQAVREAASRRGRAALALSGGTTPGRYFELLSEENIPWDSTHIFWVDERLVAPDSPDSNFRLASERLLSRVPVPAANVHPVLKREDTRGERSPAANEKHARNLSTRAYGVEIDPERTAWAYEKELRRYFGDEGFPRFDVVHLGLGNDGHTASLFPGHPALTEGSRWVVPVDYAGASPPVARVTLTLPVLNAARLVFGLTAGGAKLAMVEEIIAGNKGGYPAGLVRTAGSMLWLAAG